MADLTEDIKTNAQGPKRAEADGVEAEQHRLPDQIEADRYLKSAGAAKRTGFPVRRLKARPPGAGE